MRKKRIKGTNGTQIEGKNDFRDAERRQHYPCLHAVRTSMRVSGKNTLE